MNKMDVGTVKIRQIADETAWRHFWFNHVMTEMDGRRPGKIAQRMRDAKLPLTRRLHQLRRLKPMIGAGSKTAPSDC